MNPDVLNVLRLRYPPVMACMNLPRERLFETPSNPAPHLRARSALERVHQSFKSQVTHFWATDSSCYMVSKIEKISTKKKSW